jgi:hypothetical protein
VENNLAYVADGALRIIDVSDPTNPTGRGTYISPGLICRVRVVGGHAYVAAGIAGLQIVDVRIPAAPVLIRSYIPPSRLPIYDVQVAGDRAYIVSGPANTCGGVAGSDPTSAPPLPQSSLLHVVDVSHPTDPALLGGFDIDQQYMATAIAGNYAYIGHLAYLQVLDTSAPARIEERSTYTATGGTLQVVGDFGYVAAMYDGLRIIDVSDPRAIMPRASYVPGGVMRQVQAVEDLIFTIGTNGLQILRMHPENFPLKLMLPQAYG